jgi:O-antigen/teichoic acid export membrane protein
MLDRAYMAASVLLRMGVGLVLLIVLARVLGPTAYGFIATVFAIGTLAGLATDFGFAAKTLRDVAAHPGAGARLVSEALSVKLALTLVVIVSGGVAIALAPLPIELRLSGAALGLAVLVGAVGDLALTAYRAIGRYGREFWLTGWTSAAHLGLVVGAAIATGSVLVVAVAYLVSRLVYTAVIVAGLAPLFPGQTLGLHRPGTLAKTLHGAWRWAVDSGLNQLLGQIDGLIVAAVFGLAGAGVYQAAARLVQASLGFVAIFANVHIPRLAALFQARSPRLRRAELQMAAEFTAVGTAFGLVFWLGGPWITRWILGPDYAQTTRLWAGFAAFVLARYAAASFGAALTAHGRPGVRVLGQIAALAVLAGGFAWRLPAQQIADVPWVMTSGAVATLITYAIAFGLQTSGRMTPERADRLPSTPDIP